MAAGIVSYNFSRICSRDDRRQMPDAEAEVRVGGLVGFGMRRWLAVGFLLFKVV